jgi:hypothetical protein
MDEETKDPEATQEPTQPQAEAPKAEAPEPGVGDLMREGTRKAIAALVVLLLIVAYLGGLAYAEVHGLNMLRSGVAPDLLMWAYLGMFTLGALAIAFPLGLHYYAFDPMQRMIMQIFYFCIDLPLLGINAFTDFNVNEGQKLVQWAQFYKDYIVPSTPIIAMAMATILLLLDPHAKAFVMRQAVKAAVMQKKANDVIKAANNPEISAMVNQAAHDEVADIMTELFGRKVTRYVMNANERPAPRRNVLQSFFGYLSTAAQRILSMSMPSPSQPHDSDEPNQ